MSTFILKLTSNSCMLFAIVLSAFLVNSHFKYADLAASQGAILALIVSVSYLYLYYNDAITFFTGILFFQGNRKRNVLVLISMFRIFFKLSKNPPLNKGILSGSMMTIGLILALSRC